MSGTGYRARAQMSGIGMGREAAALYIARELEVGQENGIGRHHRRRY